MTLSRRPLPRFLALIALTSMIFLIECDEIVHPEHYLLLNSIPDPYLTNTTPEIDEFFVLYANPDSEEYTPEWKIVLNDQYALLLVIHTDHVSLTLIQYDVLFSQKHYHIVQGIMTIASTRKNGNFSSRFVDDSFPYDALLQELFNDLRKQGHDIDNQNATFLVLVPPEVSFESTETTDVKVKLLKHTSLSLPYINLCESCTSKVSYEEYAIYHNIGDVMFFETYDLKKGIVDFERTMESRPLRLFLGWSRDGFYAAGPYKLLQPEYNASGQVIDVRKSSGRVEEFVYFTPFYSIPQIIEDIRKLVGKTDSCFNHTTDDRKGRAKACEQTALYYYTSTDKFYEPRKEFDLPVHHHRPPVVRVTKEDIKQGLKVIIENRELLSFIAYQEEVDKDTEEYPITLKEIRALVTDACEGNYEKSEETKAFDSVEFCLTLEVLINQISNIVENESVDLHIKTRHSNDQPTDAGWLLGALSSKLTSIHYKDAYFLDQIKERAFKEATERRETFVFRVTTFLLTLVGAVILIGFIVKYKKRQETLIAFKEK